MQISLSQVDFLVLNLRGIDLFLEVVDANAQATGNPYDECAKYVREQIYNYQTAQFNLSQKPTVSVLAAPLTLSLKELLSRDTCDMPAYLGVISHVVYIVRNGDAVLYVGYTHYDARKRMKEHQKAHSPLGSALRSDPKAMAWTVEMIPHADNDEAFQKEKELIRELSPPFCRRRN